MEIGVRKESGIYEYNCESVQKYKSELAENVKSLLTSSNVTVENIKDEKSINDTNKQMIKNIEDVNFDDVKVSKPLDKPKEAEYKEPTKFKNFTENVDVKIISNRNEVKSKKNNQKIQKVDFDFNFDNFNDVDFSSFNGVSDNNSNSNKVKNETNFDDEFNSFSNNYKEKNTFDEDDDYKKPKLNQEEINKKFANKKAISSEDYANLEEDPIHNNNFKNKLNNMKNSQAISSSDMYEEQSENSKKI